MPPLQRLSFSRARELSIRMARLPIDEYMVKKENDKNFHSKILAINQGGSAVLTHAITKQRLTHPSLSAVFDILLTLGSTGSWSEALQAWFPQSKGYVVSSAALAPISDVEARGGSLE